MTKLFRAGFVCCSGHLVWVGLTRGGIELKLGSMEPLFISEGDPFLAVERKEGSQALPLSKKYLFVMYGNREVGYRVAFALLRRKEIKRETIFAISEACQDFSSTAEGLYDLFAYGKPYQADYIEPSLLEKMTHSR